MKYPISFDGPKDKHVFIYGIEGLRFSAYPYIGVTYEIEEPLFYQRLGSLLLKRGIHRSQWDLIYSTHFEQLVDHYVKFKRFKKKESSYNNCDFGIFATLGRMCEKENDTNLPVVGKYYVYDKIEDYLVDNFELAL